jgi:oligopeptide/dipeptide ABC transporter ATP-binding protein
MRRTVSEEAPLLEVEDLAVHFATEEGVARAVDGVSFHIRRGEVFCLVGESGCGKTVTALAIMGLLPIPPGRIVSGRIRLEGQDLLELDRSHMRQVRGRRISMIFQEPMTSLNPVFTVGNQVCEAITAHEDVSRGEARRRAVELLDRVRIPDPAGRFGQYPHEMSGGMLQRVMVAMALVGGPSLLIADEPTTALDVTIQAQILDLLQELQQEMGMSVLLITHDLGVVAEVADTVAVMYAGLIAEHAEARPLFREPLHPYMVSLFRSLPTVETGGERLSVIPGQVPDPRWFPSGCRFHPRCYLAGEQCAQLDPELREVQSGRLAACVRLPGYWPEGDPRAETLTASDAERAATD